MQIFFLSSRISRIWGQVWKECPGGLEKKGYDGKFYLEYDKKGFRVRQRAALEI